MKSDETEAAACYRPLHAAAFAANETMRADVARFARSGKPVYGECDGLMYLTQAIVDQESHAFPMVGVFPTCARMQPQLAALGYAEVEGMTNAGWLRAGEQAREHEFRYSLIDEMPDHIGRRYRVSTTAGERQEGFTVGGCWQAMCICISDRARDLQRASLQLAWRVRSFSIGERRQRGF